MAKAVQIPTTAEIADGIIEMLHNDLPTDAAELKALLEHAARTGKLAGLSQAARYVSEEWPQGQYDRFNEHSLSKKLHAAIKRVHTRIKGE